MTITICASLKAHQKIIQAKQTLENLGHQVIIPRTTHLIHQSKLTLQDLDQHKIDFGPANVVAHFDKIKQANAVLIINPTMKGIKNYIGGNTLMELGFACYLKKPIYLLNPIPQVSYSEEIRDVQPIILKGDLTKIKT